MNKNIKSIIVHLSLLYKVPIAVYNLRYKGIIRCSNFNNSRMFSIYTNTLFRIFSSPVKIHGIVDNNLKAYINHWKCISNTTDTIKYVVLRRCKHGMYDIILVNSIDQYFAITRCNTDYMNINQIYSFD